MPNGDTVINNWVNEWSTKPEDRAGTVQAIEVTLKSRWSGPLHPGQILRTWGPATTFQFLDEPSAPEDAHFGEFK